MDSKSTDSSDATGVKRSILDELTGLRSELTELRDRNARLEETVATATCTTQDKPQAGIPDGYQGNARAALVRGSPVGREEFGRASLEYTLTGMYEADGTPRWGMPKNKDMKLQLAKFSAKETHKGLGTGVNEWVNRFVRQLERAQVASGFCWPEEVKMDVLEDHLEGKALDYWQIKRDSWSG
jgi:hypothetical protein